MLDEGDGSFYGMNGRAAWPTPQTRPEASLRLLPVPPGHTAHPRQRYEGPRLIPTHTHTHTHTRSALFLIGLKTFKNAGATFFYAKVQVSYSH